VNDESPEQSRSVSWLERLTDFLGNEPKNRDELMEVLRDASDRKIISSDMLEMIESVLTVADMQVRDVMVPRSQMISVQSNSTLKEIFPVLLDSGHSRFPVMNGEKIVGILLAKDLLAFHVDHAAFQMSDIMRRAVFVPQSKRLDVLLREFRANRNHLAIVVDEYGHVAGLVTIEDVLEEIVGEIEDEYDIPEQSDITEREPGVFLVKATTPIADFNERLGTKFSEDEFDTIGGLVLKELGHFPRRGEMTRMGTYRFKVLAGDSRRVHLLEVRKVK